MSEISPTYVSARRALLDALDALADHLDALILVGAQAIYLHTGDTDEAVAPFTTDGDMAVDPDLLGDDPKLEDALGGAGFALGEGGNPGQWFDRKGVEVDLLVLDSVALGGGTRRVELPPHSSRTARRARGLEGVLVDKSPFRLAALEPGDGRAFEIAVAGPAALLVSKLHKVHERVADDGRGVKAKDSHDIYRLLLYVEPTVVEAGFALLLATEVSREPAGVALGYLRELFGTGDSPGSRMAAETVVGVAGDPLGVADRASVLALDLLDAVGGEATPD